MTDYDPELEALLARQADEVRQFVERARVTDPQGLPSLARQVSAAMGLDIDDVIAAVRELGLSGTAANVSTASGSFGAVALPKLGMAGFGDIRRTDDELAVVKREDIANLAAKVTRDSIAGLSATQVLALVLVWLFVSVTFSVTQQLPGDAQGKLTNDLAELAIGITLTLAIIKKHKR